MITLKETNYAYVPGCGQWETRMMWVVEDFESDRLRWKEEADLKMEDFIVFGW